MKTIEPKQLFDRYGRALGKFENVVVDDEEGTIEPVACCADPRAKCFHPTEALAYQEMIEYRSRKEFRVREKEWSPEKKPCAFDGCAGESNYILSYDNVKFALCVSHLNEQGMKTYIEAVENKKNTKSKYKQ